MAKTKPQTNSSKPKSAKTIKLPKPPKKKPIQYKEDHNEMEKEVSKLTEGQEFKTMQELFDYLNIELPKNGDSRKSAINHLKCWIQIEDIPNSYRKKIGEVYEEPLDLMDGRKEGNRSVYKNYLKIILLNSLLLQENYEKTYTYAQFWIEMGMCNRYYTDNEMKKKLMKTDVKINEDQMDDFFRRSWSIMRNITDSVLESLQSDGMLEYTKNRMIQREKYNLPEKATPKERALIGSEETRVLKKMGYKNKKDLFLAKKTKQFRERVKENLYKKYGWENYFDCFDIIIYEKDVLEIGLNQSIKDFKHSLNTNVVNRMKQNNITMQSNEQKKVHDKYDQYKDNLALGTPMSYDEYYVMEAFRIYQENYLEIQDLLTDCFISDSETLIDKVNQIKIDSQKTL